MRIKSQYWLKIKINVNQKKQLEINAYHITFQFDLVYFLRYQLILIFKAVPILYTMKIKINKTNKMKIKIKKLKLNKN